MVKKKSLKRKDQRADEKVRIILTLIKLIVKNHFGEEVPFETINA